MLFLHVVPIMAAVAMQPHQAEEREGMLPEHAECPHGAGVVGGGVCLLRFSRRIHGHQCCRCTPCAGMFCMLIEGLMLVGVSVWGFFTSSGAWRKLYRNIFFASSLYAFSSEAMNAAIARGTYQTGGIYDLPFLAALLGFLWVAIDGRRRLRDTVTAPRRFPRARVPAAGRSSACQTCPALFARSWPIGRCS